MNALPIGVLNKLGTITASDDGQFLSRSVILTSDDGTELEGAAWKKADNRKGLEELEAFIGKKVKYDFQAATGKRAAKLNIYTIREEQGSGGGGKSGGGWKGGGGGKSGASDAYWQGRSEDDRYMNDWRLKRESANDAKIEWQFYADLALKAATAAAQSSGKAFKAADLLGAAVQLADKLYADRNPDGPLKPDPRPVPKPAPAPQPEPKAEKAAVPPPAPPAEPEEDDDLPF